MKTESEVGMNAVGLLQWALLIAIVICGIAHFICYLSLRVPTKAFRTFVFAEVLLGTLFLLSLAWPILMAAKS